MFEAYKRIIFSWLLLSPPLALLSLSFSILKGCGQELTSSLQSVQVLQECFSWRRENSPFTVARQRNLAAPYCHISHTNFMSTKETKTPTETSLSTDTVNMQNSPRYVATKSQLFSVSESISETNQQSLPLARTIVQKGNWHLISSDSRTGKKMDVLVN